jgi:diguanylate cyclase (GGDEF)-like protein
MSSNKVEILLQKDILKTLTDNLPDMLWLKDLEGRYLFANKAICENLLMAKDIDEPIGKTDLFFAMREREKHPENPEWHTFGELCQDSDSITAEANCPMRFKEWGNVRGKLLYLEVHKAPFYDNNGKLLGILGSGRDITESVMIKKKLEAQKAKFEYQARHDTLTGLPNRKHFQEKLLHTLKRSKKTGKTVVVFLIDLDRFKYVNDIYGHDMGDRVLLRIAKRLTDTIRESDTVARMGGDEFTIIMEGVKHTKDIKMLAKKLLRTIRKPLTLDDITHHLTASIGITLCDGNGKALKTILKHADSAMYQAKIMGKNRYEFYTPDLTETAFRQIMLENELHTALKEEQFVVYFQPQVLLDSGRINGMEALVRWLHPSAGLMPPDIFISAAESCGLLSELDRWVYRTSLKQLHLWQYSGLISPDFTLSLNLPPRHLENKKFPDYFRKLLQTFGMDPACIELEITETQLFRNFTNTQALLTSLKNIGVRLAIDDFGTGYSSFIYLKKLHFDTLKIDRLFIRDIPDKEEDNSIVRAILNMAHALKMHVIAEGVESPKQHDFLKAEQCKSAQGYLFAKPLPAQEMELLLKCNKHQLFPPP